MENKKSFRNWDIGRLHLNFANGNHLSTVWGDGTYSDNHESNIITEYLLSDKKGRIPVVESNTCEIMFDCPEKLEKKILKKYNDGCSAPIGYLSITDWVEIVKLLSK